MGDRRNFMGDDPVSAPSLIWSPGSITAEEEKAQTIPVPGAIVISPLTQSWRNYGSIGGTFSKVGSPVITAGVGATFDGVNQGATIASSNSGIFTVTAKVTVNSLSGSYPRAFSVAQKQSSAGGVSVGYDAMWVPPATKWCIGRTGIEAIAGSVDVTTAAVIITLTWNKSIGRLYVNGSEVVTLSNTAVLGSYLNLACCYYASSFTGFSSSTISNVTQYPSVLSADDQSLVEQWTV